MKEQMCEKKFIAKSLYTLSDSGMSETSVYNHERRAGNIKKGKLWGNYLD